MKQRGFGEIFTTVWAMMTGGWFLLILPIAHAQLPLPLQAEEMTPKNFPQTQNNPLLLPSKPLTLVGVDIGCSKTPDLRIVGIWMAEDGMRIEFFEDCTATYQATKKTGLEGTPSSGTWTRLSDGRFKLTLSAMGFTTMNAFKASFPGNKTMEMMLEGKGSVVMKRQ